LEAWSVFSNHYHFIGHSPNEKGGAESLSQMLALLHEKTASGLIAWMELRDGQFGTISGKQNLRIRSLILRV
jgi:hypothetical protein